MASYEEDNGDDTSTHHTRRQKSHELSPLEMLTLMALPFVLVGVMYCICTAAMVASDSEDARIVSDAADHLHQWRDARKEKHSRLLCEDVGVIVQDPDLAAQCIQLDMDFRHNGPIRNTAIARRAFNDAGDDCAASNGNEYDSCKRLHLVARSYIKERLSWFRFACVLFVEYIGPLWMIVAALSIVLSISAVRRWSTYMDARALPTQFAASSRDRIVCADAETFRPSRVIKEAKRE